MSTKGILPDILDLRGSLLRSPWKWRDDGCVNLPFHTGIYSVWYPIVWVSVPLIGGPSGPLSAPFLEILPPWYILSQVALSLLGHLSLPLLQRFLFLPSSVLVFPAFCWTSSLPSLYFRRFCLSLLWR